MPSRMPWSGPAPRSAPRPSSGAMLPAIGSPPPHGRWPGGKRDDERIWMAARRPQPRPGVLDIDPYVPGKSEAPGVARVFKLSSNETPLGPSPLAKAAYLKVAEHLQDYPDGSATPLREAIGRAFGLDPNRIVCG